MINQLYGIDYNTYACGGRGNVKLALSSREIAFYETEAEMLKALINLKEDKSVGEIRPFIAELNRIKYEM
jgi:hypothetical protein